METSLRRSEKEDPSGEVKPQKAKSFLSKESFPVKCVDVVGSAEECCCCSAPLLSADMTGNSGHLSTHPGRPNFRKCQNSSFLNFFQSRSTRKRHSTTLSLKTHFCYSRSS